MPNVDQIINKITHGSMKSLNLSNNNIGNEGVIAIAEALKENQIITTLDLHNNFIGPEAATALANALRVNSSITKVILTYNNIENEGATALAEALRVNKTVTSLNLWMNKIGPVGATELAEALKVNKTVTSLNLSNNKIGPVGATALANALKVNSNIASLNLSRNEIEDEGATAIADAVTVNNTIKELYLTENNFGPTGVTALAEAFKVNSTIIYFVFEIYEISKDLFRKLSYVKPDNKLSNEIISGLSDIFIQVMIPRTMDPVTDILYSNLSTMEKSTLTRNLVAKTKDRQTKLSQVQNDATQIYDKIHHTNNYFTFDVNKRETVKKEEQEIWYKFNEYLSITKQQLSLDTYVPRKLLLELFELYVDNGIIKFSKIRALRGAKEKVLQKLNRIVAFKYINILRDELPVDDIDELKKNLIQEEQKQREKLNRILALKDINSLRDELPPAEIDELTKKYSTSSSTSKQTSTSTSTQTQRPYYKKLEKKIFQLHYEEIINTIIQSNKKKIVNIRKQINQLEKSKGNQTEKQITQKHIKIRRRTISNIMTNNQRMNQLKQIKNNEMDVIKNQTQSQNQRIQKKILDNMLPETFPLKFPTIRKRKFQQNTQQQNLKNKKLKTQQGQKQSNKKTKQKIIFKRVGHSTRGPVIKYTDPQSGNQISPHTISEEDLQSKIKAGEYQQQI